MRLRMPCLRLVVFAFPCVMAVYGQSGEYPRTPWGGYPYAASYDAEIAAPNVHRVLFEDEHVMFIEVANPPGLDVRMHGHPYPSVFARDTGGGPTKSTGPASAAGVPLNDTHLDPGSIFAGKGWGQGGPPAGLEFPLCTTAPPEGPHKPINRGSVPVHFYRLEFRRLDGEGLRTHWRQWYPWMLESGKPVADLGLKPGLGPKLSEQWPYSRLYDSVLAAPNNYRLLYEDSHVRLLEVGVRPGETTPFHGHPYASVLAFDTAPAGSGEIVDTKLDPNSLLNGQGAGHGPPPSILNMTAPSCMTLAPQAPHSIQNKGDAPLHYYRIEFKRVDGEAFASHWQDWYPWMKYMKYMR